MDNLPALKTAELTPCKGCGKPLGEAGLTFWQLRADRCCLDPQALRERVGLAMMMNSAPLAEVFASRDPARVFDRLHPFSVCEDCAATLPLTFLALQDASEDAAHG